MKKTALIALLGFVLGIFLAGLIFIYLPEKNSPESFFEEPSSPWLSSSLYASSSPQSRPDLDFATIAEKVAPAVVYVEAERVEKRRVRDLFDDPLFEDFWRFFGTPQRRGQEYHSYAQGSGFFISSDGYAITNYHIVENAKEITITTLQGNVYKAKIIGTDSESDLALLKVDEKNLPFIELGDSSRLRTGEWVLAIGNPFRLEHTVTAGIVSAKGRQLSVGPRYQNFIQTDAAINPGNSGGPLVNTKGEVVGINSMISTTSGSRGNIGIGFAIPSSLAKKVVNQLKDKGKVIRGYLGVRGIYSIDEQKKNNLNLKSKQGAMILEVEPGTPAEKAGLKPYDVIVEVDGQPVKDANDLLFKIADIRPGTKVDIKVIRNQGKEEKTLTANITEYKSGEEQETVSASDKDIDIGFKVTELTSRLARRLGYRTQEGLIITDVTPYSEADRKGIKNGDIILEVNQKKIKNTRDLVNILKKAKSGDVIMLKIRRESNGQMQDSIKVLSIPE